MKTFKRIIPFFLALIMTLAIPLAACGDTDGDGDKTEITLQSISLNTDNVKKEYFYGEQFTSEGLVVTAVFARSDSDTPDVKTLTADEYQVKSTSFRNDYYSDYTITVSYTYGEITKSSNYTVSVVSSLTKVEVDASAAKTAYYTGDSFSSDGLVVKAYFKKSGSTDLEEKTLTSSEYSVDSKAFNNTKSGTYPISVSYTDQGGATKSASYNVTVTDVLAKIELDLTKVKTKFYTDDKKVDEFSDDGIAAKATIWNKTTKAWEEKSLTKADLVIDSSAFKKEIGEYDIIVSYTYEGITKSASYKVYFLASLDGLSVELAEGVANTYDLTAANPTVEIDVSKIVVKEANRDGSIGKVVTDYTVKLYRGSEEVPLTDGKATVGVGAYNILVTKESEIHAGFVRAGFVVIYVNDELVDFKWKSGDLKQEKGPDVISDTWVFEATYVSGVVKEVRAKDCDYKIDTWTMANDAKVTVSYTDYNAYGVATTKTVDLVYNVTLKYGATTYTLDLSKIDLASGTALTQDHLVGYNSFLTVGSGNATYKVDKGNTFIELAKSKSLQVTFSGTGHITIGFASTGGTNWSSVALKDPDGKYVAATFNAGEGEAVVAKADPDLAGAYLVYGVTAVEFTFTITKPGTYTITCADNSSYGRACRIYSLTMLDDVPAPQEASAAALANVDYSNQTYAIIKKVEQV